MTSSAAALTTAVPLPAAATRLGPGLPARPRLEAAAARAWRGDGALQVGRPPGRAVVVEGLTAADRSLLDLLDGTRDVPRLHRDAERVGAPPERVEAVLRLLADAGALDDAALPAPARGRADRDRLAADSASLRRLHGRAAAAAAVERRGRARVLVVGGGRVGSLVAALLAAAGVGAVDVLDDEPVSARDTAPGGATADDVGRRRDVAGRGAVARVSPGALDEEARAPHLVVVAPAPSATAAQALAGAPRGVPLLVVEVREAAGVVGPLVLPGTSACPRCLDLARADRDPSWPRVTAQLDATHWDDAACDVVLAAATAAQAAAQALGFVDGGSPAAVDGTLELALPDWRWRRRSWHRHEACGC